MRRARNRALAESRSARPDALYRWGRADAEIHVDATLFEVSTDLCLIVLYEVLIDGPYDEFVDRGAQVLP
jgi:hypothetical protein